MRRRVFGFAVLLVALGAGFFFLRPRTLPVDAGLWNAVVNRDVAGVREALGKHPDLEATHEEMTPLFAAVATGDVAVVRLLIDSGAKLEATSKGGWTPLLLAARRGHEEVVRVLAGAGASPRARLDRGSTLLHQAAFSADTGTMAAAIALDPSDVNVASSSGATPVYVAAFEGNVQCLKLLLDAGGDPNITWPDGFGPLHAAAQHGFIDVVKLLIERGAKVNTPLDDGCTAVDLARDANKPVLVDFLISRGGAPGPSRRSNSAPRYHQLLD